MTVRECMQRLEAEVVVGDEWLDRKVESVAASDLLSDVLATHKHNFLLLTGLSTPQVVRTAELMGSVGIVFCRGKYPPQDAIGMAKVHGIPLLCTRLQMFEACCRLAGLGLEQDSTP
ncbi:MAG: PucR family transcriptional regulator ligand-binding domain-containing protein [bacterium]|nr:PucR family transcriptional regulator ligand-binding domain-containing protein [bacterium]